MTYPALVIFNTVVCGAVIVVCIGRLALCHPGIAALVRLKYTVLLTGALAHGFQPLFFGTWPNAAGVILSSATLVGVLCSAHRWRNRPPPETETAPAPLMD
ncbi:hypothetical protein [Acidovorax phage ACPWH]|nr:hypothetical protein [Acidovorax phage ACPWH]QXV72276.1 hypothetical protein Acf1_00079 [Acidovorax phage ACF1]